MRILLLLLSMASVVVSASDREVRDYLMSNPEVVWEALEMHKHKLLHEKLEKIVMSEKSQVVVENARGKNKLVMFMDYRCGACRRTYPWVEEFAKSHQDVQIVMKPYPVLGTESIQASLMLYDARELNLEAELHKGLIDPKQSFSIDRLRELGKMYKINVHLPSTLKQHWAYPLLEGTHKDSVDLENQSVPLFILAVGDQYLVIRGLSSKDDLDKAYNQMS